MAGADLDAGIDFDLDRVEQHHLVLGGILLVGTALRAYGLGAESLWYDEVFTAQVVGFESLEHVLFELPRLDPHPTFYYVVMKGWTALAGRSEVGLRSLSVVADAGSIALIYLVATRLYERRVGLFSALLFALSPFYFWYGREARMYALLAVLTLASFYLLLRMGQADLRWRTAAGYLLVTVALCHTHAFGPLVVAAQNVYVLGTLAAGWRAHGAAPRRVGDLPAGRWVGFQVAVAVAAAPYYYVLYRGMFVTERFETYISWVPEASLLTVWKILGTYVGRTVPPTAPWGRESLWAFGPSGELGVLGELVTLLALAGVAFALTRYDRDDGDREPFAPEPLLAAWAFSPVVVLYVLSRTVTPLLYDRFTAAAGLGFLILLARGLTLLADSRRDLAVVAAATVVVLAVPLAGLHAGPQKPQVREAAGILENDVEAGDVVVVSPRWDDSYDYYLGDWAEADSRSRLSGTTVERVRAGAPRGELQRVVFGRDVVWLVVSFQNETQRQRMVSAMEELGYEIDRHEDLTKVDVYRFVDGE